MRTIAAIALGLLSAAPAYAQYYAPPPPPGYYRDPYRPRIGRHCEAFLRTPYGPRRIFCPIVDPKPVGEGCACPPPPEYEGGPYVGGADGSVEALQTAAVRLGRSEPR